MLTLPVVQRLLGHPEEVGQFGVGRTELRQLRGLLGVLRAIRAGTTAFRLRRWFGWSTHGMRKNVSLSPRAASMIYRRPAGRGKQKARDRFPGAGELWSEDLRGDTVRFALCMGPRIRTGTARFWRPAGYRCHSPKQKAPVSQGQRGHSFQRCPFLIRETVTRETLKRFAISVLGPTAVRISRTLFQSNLAAQCLSPIGGTPLPPNLCRPIATVSRLFSVTVPLYKWCGFTHKETPHRWQASLPAWTVPPSCWSRRR